MMLSVFGAFMRPKKHEGSQRKIEMPPQGLKPAFYLLRFRHD
jgi:hypothetical protein